jgi:sorbitol/mannitol transport system permease protein
MSTLTPAAPRKTAPARASSTTAPLRRGKSRMDPTRNNTAAGLAAWLLALLFAAPVVWMILTSFHSETDAATNPPSIAANLTLDA